MGVRGADVCVVVVWLPAGEIEAVVFDAVRTHARVLIDVIAAPNKRANAACLKTREESQVDCIRK
jgi:hypothetical protein